MKFINKGIAPEFSLAVVAIAKNEAPYLAEWLSHYRALGVEHFFIADNGSNDGTQELLQTEAAYGDITWEEWLPEGMAQISWYRECLNRYGPLCQWMAFFDIDEFLVASSETSVLSQLDQLLEPRRVGGVAVNWRIFGSSHYQRMQPGAVSQRFTLASRMNRQVNKHVKCIVKPKAVRKAYVHAPELSFGYHYLTPGGERVQFIGGEAKSGRSEQVSSHGLIINHYNVKSQQEFVDIKAARGRANMGTAHCRDMGYFKGHDLNDIQVQATSAYALQKQHYKRLPDTLTRNVPLWFVHIPKTAGTSFRLGAAEMLGSERVWNDYGAQSAETHPIIARNIYQLKDMYAFRQRLEGQPLAMLAGHVPASKYFDLAGVRNTFSFVRDPVQRVISDYKHFVRHAGYEGSLESFINRKELQNRQARFLSGAPLHAYGLIGLSERYQEGLALLNHQYGLGIPERTDNVADRVGEPHALAAEDVASIMALNQKDITLYQQATVLFEQRVMLHEQHLPFVHGAIQKVTNRQVMGWAWWGLSDLPVELEILVDGELIARTVACDLRPGLMRWAPPRSGYVGFKSAIQAKVGAVISCRVAMTGQVIDTQVVDDE